MLFALLQKSVIYEACEREKFRKVSMERGVHSVAAHVTIVRTKICIARNTAVGTWKRRIGELSTKNSAKNSRRDSDGDGGAQKEDISSLRQEELSTCEGAK